MQQCLSLHTLHTLPYIHYHTYTAYTTIHTLHTLPYIHHIHYHIYTTYTTIHTLHTLPYIHTLHTLHVLFLTAGNKFKFCAESCYGLVTDPFKLCFRSDDSRSKFPVPCLIALRLWVHRLLLWHLPQSGAGT